MRAGVLGTGHVGLVTAVSLAALGHEVTGTDSDAEKVSLLQRGRAPFYEPGLEELLEEGARQGKLRFTRSDAEAVGGADVVFICVGTPPRASGKANLLAVEKAAHEAAKHATGRTVVVDKSTVPAGTAQRVKRVLREERPDLVGDLEVASNPEFLREGSAIEDSLRPTRILVGAESEWAFETMRRLYEPLTARGVPLIETDITTAELAKHACNAFLATKVSFINALARVCELAGADVDAVAAVMGADPRIGSEFLKAGLGFGGYCLPKDLQAFERLSAGVGYDFALLREVARINEEAIDACVAKIEEAVWNLEGKKIALLGLSFKPGTDDVRLSPSLSLAQALLAEGANVTGYDPQAVANAKAEISQMDFAPDPYEAAAGAHCLVIGTDWPEFGDLDLERLARVMARRTIVDARNVLDADAARAAGFEYHPTGKPSVH